MFANATKLTSVLTGRLESFGLTQESQGLVADWWVFTQHHQAIVPLSWFRILLSARGASKSCAIFDNFYSASIVLESWTREQQIHSSCTVRTLTQELQITSDSLILFLIYTRYIPVQFVLDLF